MEKYEPPFVLTNEIMNLVSNIMEKIGKINVFNELDKLPVLRKQNRIRSIHSSCAIEANSLSLDQVSDVINGKVVYGPQKDIREVKNVIKAYDLIESINPYLKKDLLKIHSIIGGRTRVSELRHEEENSRKSKVGSRKHTYLAYLFDSGRTGNGDDRDG